MTDNVAASRSMSPKCSPASSPRRIPVFAALHSAACMRWPAVWSRKERSW